MLTEKGDASMKEYQNYLFDLYGTLVDIHTDENDPRLWQRMSVLPFLSSSERRCSSRTFRYGYLVTT